MALSLGHEPSVDIPAWSHIPMLTFAVLYVTPCGYSHLVMFLHGDTDIGPVSQY